MIQKAADSKVTTVVGGLASLGGIIVALLPTDVKDQCFTAVQNSPNPAMVGGLLAGGLILTLIGPTLTKKS